VPTVPLAVVPPTFTEPLAPLGLTFPLAAAPLVSVPPMRAPASSN
jgi:hypothetical protein